MPLVMSIDPACHVLLRLLVHIGVFWFVEIVSMLKVQHNAFTLWHDELF